MREHVIAIGVLVLSVGMTFGAENRGVRASGLNYLDLAKAYADAMIEAGCDTYGEVHSPLFASTLDRKTMKIGEQPGVPGVRSSDRNLYGANLQEDLGLYHLLYDLTEVTGDKQYAREADKAFEFFFKNTQSPVTGFYPWGEHLCWNFETDKAAGWKMMHEMNYPWPHWDKAPAENFWKFTLGFLDHGIITRDDGSITFSRHTQYDRHNPWQDSQYPRIGGQFIVTFMEAYGRPDSKDQPRREELLKMAERVMATYEEKLKNCGYIPDAGAAMGIKNGTRMDSWPDQSIELARCVWEGAEHAPEPLKGRMRKFSLAVEKTFFENNPRNPIEHKVSSGGGFHIRVKHPRKPGEKPEGAPSTWTTDWSFGYGGAQTHATIIMTRLLPRYEQVKKEHPEIAARYVEMFRAVAEIYMTSEPDLKNPLTPGAFAAVIEFLTAMHTMTGESKYLERADHFARLGVGLFIDGDSPLPKASSENDHYETKTNGPDFMHTLLTLHRKGLRPKIRIGGGIGPMGHITMWMLAGPFQDKAKEGKSAFDRVLSKGNLSWKPLKMSSGTTDLERHLGKHDDCCAFVRATVQSPVEQVARLEMWCDNHGIALLNGEVVASGGYPKSISADVELKKGENVLILKLIEESGAWGFWCRITDRESKVIEGLEVKAE